MTLIFGHVILSLIVDVSAFEFKTLSNGVKGFPLQIYNLDINKLCFSINPSYDF